MKKKSTKDKLIEGYKKRIWGRDKNEDNDLLDILFHVMELEKASLRKKAPQKVVKKVAKKIIKKTSKKSTL